MKHEIRFHLSPLQIDPDLLGNQAGLGYRPALHSREPRRSFKRSFTGRPQIPQGNKRDPLRRVFGQPVVTLLDANELEPHELNPGIKLGMSADLHPLRFASKASPARAPIERIARAWTHGRVPAVTSVTARHGGKLGVRNTRTPMQELRPAHASELVRLKGGD